VGPVDRIQALCQAYFQFARQHLPLWRLVFEHRLPPGEPLPAWFEDRVGELLDMVSQELEPILKTQTPAQIRMAARTLWGSVHGICVLALGDKLSVGGDVVSAEHLIDSLVANYLAGLGHVRTPLDVTTTETNARGRP
jgi:AcrR family transcriptional regulator